MSRSSIPEALCTTGRGRRVNRWEKEHLIERMAEHLAKRPDLLVIRRSTAEHPFGTIKQSMNQGALPMRGLPLAPAPMRPFDT